MQIPKMIFLLQSPCKKRIRFMYDCVNTSVFFQDCIVPDPLYGSVLIHFYITLRHATLSEEVFDTKRTQIVSNISIVIPFSYIPFSPFSDSPFLPQLYRSSFINVFRARKNQLGEIGKKKKTFHINLNICFFVSFAFCRNITCSTKLRIF